MTTLLSKFYMYAFETYPLDEHLLFIQIIDVSDLKEKSKKPLQFNNIENAIRAYLQKNRSKVTYSLVQMSMLDFDKPFNKIINTILTHLEKGN